MGHGALHAVGQPDRNQKQYDHNDDNQDFHDGASCRPGP
jgi:hypothetical protein